MRIELLDPRLFSRHSPVAKVRWFAAVIVYLWLIAPAAEAALFAVSGATTDTRASGGTTGAAETATSTDRLDLIRELGRQIRQGELVAARSTALAYLALFPLDGVMTYNLACLEARLANIEAAWQNLEQAFARGFTDLRTMETDPDLANMRSQPRFAAWLQECRSVLTQRSQARAVSLREGYWSEEFLLEPNDAADPGLERPEVRVKVRATWDGIGLQAIVHAGRFLDHQQPWRYGDGMLVNIVVPLEEEVASFESTRFFSFGFGLENQQPIGAFVGRHGQRLDQRVVELDPKIRLLGADQATYTIQIPWRSVEPYAPPLDSLLGLNIVYLRVDEYGIRQSVSLIPDPEFDSDRVPWRRYVPVTIQSSDLSQPVLRGRVGDTVVGDEPLELTLIAWSAAAGTGQLDIEFLDVAGRSVLGAGRGRAGVRLQQGMNRWQQRVDMAPLPSGPFVVRADFTLPTGVTLTWQANLLRLREDWYAALAEQLAVVRQDERLSVRTRLDAVRTALTTRHRWDDPAAIGTTLAEAGVMIQRAEQTGTILPAEGLVSLAIPGPGDVPLICYLNLPQVAGAQPVPELLVLLLDRTGGEVWLARRAGAALAAGNAPFLLVPEVAVIDPQHTDRLLLGVDAVVTWARTRFAAGPVWLVGLGRGAADALHYSLRHPADCRAVLMLVDEQFQFWSGRDVAGLVKDWTANRHDVPLTLDRLPGTAGGSGQAATLVTALLQAGFTLQEDITTDRPRARTVEDRIATWIADTRRPTATIDASDKN